MASPGRSARPPRPRWAVLARSANVKRLYRLWMAIGLLILVVAIIIILAPPFRAATHTAFFVLQTLDAPFKPQPWFTRTPLREEVKYSRPDGQGVADIYRIPDNQRRAAVLIFLGANAAGRGDPDVINLGDALARTGFVVMFHWSPTMGLRYNIDPEEIEGLVHAFQYLLAQDFVDRGRAGMGGFSVGGSFALVAAADSRIRDDVVFVNSFGAYYDAQDLFLQIASRSRLNDPESGPWDVDRLTWLVFANELTETLDNPAERELLERHFLRNETAPGPALEALSVQAQSVRTLLEGTSVAEAKMLLESLPPDFHQKMVAISPSAHISDLHARLMIMHDDGDFLIPVGESRRLAKALEGRKDFRYTETRLFDHVRPGEGVGPWLLLTEGVKLFRHMYGIIRVAV